MRSARQAATQLRILAVETSCDDTAAAVIEGSGRILSNVIAKQHKLHARYKGIVPQLASDAHRARLPSVISSSLQAANLKLQDVDFMAVTRGPGLSRCLSVGFDAMNILSAATGIPCYHINHLVASINPILILVGRSSALC